MTCQHPECDSDAVEQYEDHQGNDLDLCADHYFEAVYPGGGTFASSIVRKRKHEDADGLLSAVRRLFT